MTGDFSRFTDDPRGRVATVLLQQGRVLLDADFNEAGLRAEERRRRQALDTFGPAAVSTLASATSGDAFKLTAAGGDLLITPGRMWVDGLPAECLPDDGWNPPGSPPSYLNQPFLRDTEKPGAAMLPALAWLEVRTREVDRLQDPELPDRALEGLDTATRLVTAWQLRLQPKAGGIDPTCANAKDLLPKPSRGRLSASAIAPPSVDDPCLIAPDGGYRGIENRLYRVQVHAVAVGGDVLLKFSRDNASVRSALRAVGVVGGRSVATVERIGRDAVLRFQVGDWVEVTDDLRELGDRPGEMAQVVAVDESERSLTLDRALVFAGTEAELEARHARVIRWDQRAPGNAVDADGLVRLAAPAGLALEEGISIRLTVAAGAGDAFRTGDHWCFAARTVEGWVEPLAEAPPRGILRAAAALAEIVAGPNGEPVVARDCRVMWPPLGDRSCCTEVVHPGEDIQAAIDRVCRAGGGCVCLKVGEHRIDRPLHIACADLRLEGESPAAVVVAERLTPLLDIDGANGRAARVSVTGIRFLLRGERAEGGKALLSVSGGRDVSLLDLAIEAERRENDLVGILVTQTADAVRIERCRITGVDTGVLANEGAQRVVLRDLSLPRGREDEPARVGIWLQDLRAAALVEGCEIEGYARGIVLGQQIAFLSGAAASRAVGSRIAANRITVGQRRPNERDQDPAAGIVVAAEGCVVEGNAVVIQKADPVGIAGTAAGVRILGNRVEALLEELPRSIGILLRPGGADALLGAGVEGNTLRSAGTGVLAQDTLSVRISGNSVSACELGIGLSGGEGASVVGNRVSRCTRGLAAPAQPVGPGGDPRPVARPTIADNDFESCSFAAMDARGLRGTALVSGNRVRLAGWARPREDELQASVELRADERDFDAEIISDGNVIEEWGREAARRSLNDWPVMALRVVAPRVVVRDCRIANLAIEEAGREALDTELPNQALVVAAFTRRGRPPAGRAQVVDNQVLGASVTGLVELRDAVGVPGDRRGRPGHLRVQLGDNAVEHRSAPRADPARPEDASCLVRGSSLTVTGNVLRAEGDYPPLNLFRPMLNQPGPPPRTAVVTGNVFSAQPIQAALVVPASVTDANVIVP